MKSSNSWSCDNIRDNIRIRYHNWLFGKLFCWPVEAGTDWCQPPTNNTWNCLEIKFISFDRSWSPKTLWFSCKCERKTLLRTISGLSITILNAKDHGIKKIKPSQKVIFAVCFGDLEETFFFLKLCRLCSATTYFQAYVYQLENFN